MNAAVFKQYDCYDCAMKAAAALSSMERVMIVNSRMYVCPLCGNKRCPKATSHTLDCTNSNEPGQPGSRYGGGPVR